MADNKKKKPLPKGSKGRESNGRFKKGEWSGGPGNPYAKQSAELRAALYKAVTPKDIAEIAEKLVLKAKRADVPAVKELFDRLWGKAPQDLNLGGQEDNPIEVSIGGNLTEEEIRRIADAVSAGRGAVK